MNIILFFYSLLCISGYKMACYQTNCSFIGLILFACSLLFSKKKFGGLQSLVLLRESLFDGIIIEIKLCLSA